MQPRHNTGCSTKKASYIQIAYSAPIASKRRKGRPVLTVGCLARQPNELQGAVGVDLPPSSSNDDDDEPLALGNTPDAELAVVHKKRGRPKKLSPQLLKDAQKD